MRPGRRRPASGKRRNTSERIKACIRARVERPLHIIKNLFGLKNVRYPGLSKNRAQLSTALWSGQSADCKAAIARTSRPSCYTGM